MADNTTADSAEKLNTLAGLLADRSTPEERNAADALRHLASLVLAEGDSEESPEAKAAPAKVPGFGPGGPMAGWNA